jgi:hypothetical protein
MQISVRLKNLRVKKKAALLDRRLKRRQYNSVQRAYERAIKLVNELENKIDVELEKLERKHNELQRGRTKAVHHRRAEKPQAQLDP